MRIPSSAEFSMFSSGLLDCVRMYDYVKQYGVDRSFVALCNYDLRLDRNLNITLPALAECSEYGNPHDAVSQACMEGLGSLIQKGINKLIELWNKFVEMVSGWKKRIAEALSNTKLGKSYRWTTGRAGSFPIPESLNYIVLAAQDLNWDDLHHEIGRLKFTLEKTFQRAPGEALKALSPGTMSSFLATVGEFNKQIGKARMHANMMSDKVTSMSSSMIDRDSIDTLIRQYDNIRESAVSLLNKLDNSIVISVSNLYSFVDETFRQIRNLRENNEGNDELNIDPSDLRVFSIFTKNCGDMNRSLSVVIQHLVSVNEQCLQSIAQLEKFKLSK